jgi:hypothetical protein
MDGARRRGGIIETPTRRQHPVWVKRGKCLQMVDFETVCKACAYRNVWGISPALSAFAIKTFAATIQVVY